MPNRDASTLPWWLVFATVVIAAWLVVAAVTWRAHERQILNLKRFFGHDH